MGGVDRPDLGDRHLPVGKDLEHECFEFFVTAVGDDLVGDEVRVSFQHEVEDGLGAFDRLDRCDFTQDQLSLQHFSQLRPGQPVSAPPNRPHAGLNPSGELSKGWIPTRRYGDEDTADTRWCATQASPSKNPRTSPARFPGGSENTKSGSLRRLLRTIPGPRTLLRNRPSGSEW